MGLDPSKIYDIREASLDREDLHLVFHDGTIAFTQAVNGKITGALFMGEGEILVMPPNSAERQSLALFTKKGVLNEQFTLAYFRFVDDQFFESVRPFLRQAENPQEFFATNDPIAKTLAEGDALRLLVGLTRDPAAKQKHSYLHGRMTGVKLGTFDVFFDTALAEQISIAQATYNERGRFYDIWASFPMRSVRKEEQKFVEALRPENYRIKSEVTLPTNIAGDCTFDLRVNQGGDRTVLFELSRFLKLSRVSLEAEGKSEPLEFLQNEAVEGTHLARRGNDVVAILFPRALQTGEKITLRFTYSGPVLSEAGGGLMYVGARGTWFPNRGAGLAKFDLEFRHPKEWTLLATGNLASRSEEGTLAVSRWVTEDPVPVAGFNLGKYESQAVEAKAAGVQVNVFAARAAEDVLARRATAQGASSSAPPNIFTPGRRNRPQIITPPALAPDPASNALQVAKLAARTIDFWSPKIGAFPYSGLALSQMPGPASQGWPGLVFLSSFTFLDPAERARLRRGPQPEILELLYAKVMVPHEVAHQWWGDAVFWQSYRDQWLSEGLANYSSLMLLEEQDPAAFRKMMDYYRDELLVKAETANDQPMKNAGAVSMGLRLSSSKYPEAYDTIAYGRGTWLIHMLRHMVREESAPRPGRRRAAAATSADPDAAFFAALKNVQQNFRGKALTARDLLVEFEKALPASARFEKKASLDWFREEWIDGVAVPKLRLEKVKISAGKAGNRATALLTQQESPDSLVTSVPLYADMGNNALSFVGRVFAEGKETDIDMRVPVGTKRLVLDPYRTVLREE